MGADHSQPDGRGQKPSDETKDPSPESVSPWSDDEFAALFSTVDLSGNTLYRELRLDPDGVVGEHIESEMRDALERRIPDSLLRRAMCTVCGETEEGRVVTSLEFRRNGGSLVPAAHLVEDPDPSEPGGFRGQASDKKKKLVVGTIAGNGALDERDWEIVPGQVTVILTQRYPQNNSDGYTMQLTANSMETVRAMFADITTVERKGKPSGARYLLDRAVAARLAEEGGDREAPLDYIVITPLKPLDDGTAALNVAVAVKLPGDEKFRAIEGRNIEVSLSPAKLITISGGAWFDCGPAEQYVERLEKLEREKREGRSDE